MPALKRTCWAAMVVLTLMIAAPLAAQETGLSQTELRQFALIEAQHKAAQWNLSEEDWVRFREIMAGPRGTWTPNADPLLVLGAAARSDADRTRYADAFVKLEFERVLGELQFQKAVDAAWPRNFPNQQRLAERPFETTSHRRIEDRLASLRVQRYALVVEKSCSGCDAKLREYLQLMAKEKGRQVLDIYVRKTGSDDDALRKWVATSNVPINLIKGGRVTVNHGDQYKAGGVPQIWALKGDGQWQTVK